MNGHNHHFFKVIIARVQQGEMSRKNCVCVSVCVYVYKWICNVLTLPSVVLNKSWEAEETNVLQGAIHLVMIIITISIRIITMYFLTDKCSVSMRMWTLYRKEKKNLCPWSTQ